MFGSGLRLGVGFVNPCQSWLGSLVGVYGHGLWCCLSFAGCLWCSWLGLGFGLLMGRVWFRARFACLPPFPVPVCVVGVRAGPGSRLCPALLGSVVGVCFLRFFFFGFVVSVAGCPCPGPCGLSPYALSFGLGCWLFFFRGVCLHVSLPLFPVSRCSWLGVAGFGWAVPPCLFGGPVFGAFWVGGLAAFCVVGGRFGGCGLFSRRPPPCFFFGGGPACSSLCLPWARARTVAGVWCGWPLATPGGGSCVLLPATPGWVSLPLVVGDPRHSSLRVPGAVPRHSWLGSAGGGGVWCAAVVCWWGCGWCVVWLVPRHSWRRFLCATPRHSWLDFAAPGGARSSPLLAEGPRCGSPPLLAGVRWRRWCVVCGGGVLVGLWLVCGVVGPSPLLAEVPVCYSPPLLAGFRCLWWWAFLATPGGGSRARFPATPGWVSLSAVVCGVWCVVCGVRRWCVCGVLAGVWCGWSLTTPGGGSCVLLPATPGWVSLPVGLRGPRHSWLRVPGAVPRHSWLGSAGGGGVWCVVCGGGVLVGLWLVCGVVGPSPLLAEVPVCYSPPLLAGFCCRWWCAVLATPGSGSRARFPATPGWGPLAAMVCGVRRWCGGGVVAGVWCGWSLATPGGGSCVLLPATPGWISLPVVVRGPRHSWLKVLGAVPRHSWLGFAVGGGGRSSPLLAEGPGCGCPPLLAGVRWRRCCVVCGGGVLVGVWLVCGVVCPSPIPAEVPVCYSPPLLAGFRCQWWWAFLATPGGGSRARFPATPGWVSLLVSVCGVRCVVCGVRRWCVGGVVAGVWCGWSLATPGGGSCVLLPATPGWVSLPVGVRGPRHSWLRVPGAVPRSSWLGSAGGGGVWCVVCGGGVLVGLWLVCGVVGPSPLLAEVPVCYYPPLLAGFRCRWWWAILATPG